MNNDISRPSRSQPGRVFDVRRPGRAPATATSRPIIVTNKPEVQDPMNIPVGNVAPSAPEVPAQTQASLQNTPLATEQPKPVVAGAANALHPPEEPLLMPQNAPDLPDPDLDSSLVAEPPASESQVSSPSTPDPTSQMQTQALGDHPLPVHEDQLPDLHDLSPLPTDHQENMLAGKPIISHHRGNWASILLKVLGILILLAVLAAIVLDILLDGGFVVLKGVPHTHFF